MAVRCPAGCDGGTIRLPSPYLNRPCSLCKGTGIVCEQTAERYRAAQRRRLGREARRFFAGEE